MKRTCQQEPEKNVCSPCLHVRSLNLHLLDSPRPPKAPSRAEKKLQVMTTSTRMPWWFTMYQPPSKEPSMHYHSSSYHGPLICYYFYSQVLGDVTETHRGEINLTNIKQWTMAAPGLELRSLGSQGYVHLMLYNTAPNPCETGFHRSKKVTQSDEAKGPTLFPCLCPLPPVVFSMC